MTQKRSVKSSIAIIGSGHMGTALVEGLVRGGVSARRITVSGPSALRNPSLRKLSVRVMRDNEEATRMAQWVFLAVKPAMMQLVLSEIEPAIQGKVIISLAARIRVAALKKHARGARVVRIMPNVPVAVGGGVIGYFSRDLAKDEEKELLKILSRLGAVIKTKSERELDIITLVAGCGPGIVAFLVDMFAKEAKALGLSPQAASQVVGETFRGTLAYLAHKKVSPEALMTSVATKGGVTETILTAFKKYDLTKSFARALQAGRIKLC